MTYPTRLLFATCALVFSTLVRADVVEYIHTDLQGTVVAVTDENGAIIERRTYEPYGLPTTAIADGPGFTGHDMDGETGLIYMQQRYYDPEIGRFLSVDPDPVDPASAWNFNRYNYAANNPYRYTDPDGREINGQYHPVVPGQYHLSIRITPNNQAAYVNDSRFLTDSVTGERYATIGAGAVPANPVTIPTPLGLMVTVPTALNLVSDINRASDADRSIHPSSNDLPVAVPSQYSSEDAFIEALFSSDANYSDSVRYGLPGGSGYNSNSYTNGLLEATGATSLEAPVSTPLSDKPLPREEFRR